MIICSFVISLRIATWPSCFLFATLWIPLQVFLLQLTIVLFTTLFATLCVCVCLIKSLCTFKQPSVCHLVRHLVCVCLIKSLCTFKQPFVCHLVRHLVCVSHQVLVYIQTTFRSPPCSPPWVCVFHLVLVFIQTTFGSPPCSPPCVCLI